jgi:deoxyribodipyrimidine photolyase-related protein
VWREGYSHHITRLMVLGNLATLLDVDPQQLRDWFWVAYVDAFDWVVEPNVLGMASFALGDAMTTKPYVSGAAYLAKMGDACRSCAFDPRKDCPLTPLYWAFLERHAEALRGVERMVLPLRSMERRTEAQRAAAARAFERVSAALQRGELLTPAGLAYADEGPS